MSEDTDTGGGLEPIKNQLANLNVLFQKDIQKGVQSLLNYNIKSKMLRKTWVSYESFLTPS